MINIIKLNLNEILKAYKNKEGVLYCVNNDSNGVMIDNISKFGTGFYNVSFKLKGQNVSITIGPSGCEISSGNFVFYKIDY